MVVELELLILRVNDVPNIVFLPDKEKTINIFIHLYTNTVGHETSDRLSP
jgi:hypothetical protein